MCWHRRPPSKHPSSDRTVDVIKVTATVFDKNGDLVTDLTRDDFRVLDEGVEQPIQFFGRAYEPGQDE